MSVEGMLAQLEPAWPATPDIASAVVPHIEGLTDLQMGYGLRGRRRVRLRRPLALALAALLVLAASAAAVPGIREPVLDWLGLRSVRIERIQRPLPQPKPRPARAAGADLGLGRHVRLAYARPRLSFTPLVAPGLGTPVVYYENFPPGGRLGLVYRGGKLFLVEFIGTTNNEFLRKFVTPATRLERLRINGERALWIHGGLDQYVYEDRTGAIRPEQIHTAGKVLLWRRGRVMLRLEGARTRAEALRIARSLRVAP